MYLFFKMISRSFGRHPKGCAALASVFVCVGLVLNVHAQGLGRVEQTQSNVDAYYYHVQPGAATVQVHVLGTVQSPGVYEVNEGTDLGTLLALAGGPTLDTQRGSERRKVTIRLFRRRAEGRDVVYEAVFDQTAAESNAYPPLQDGDLLTVEVLQRSRFSWRDLFTVVNTVALLALSVERLR